MLKYFATPLWAIHTTRGVQDVVKWIPEVHKRPPDIMHVACKWRRALGAHDPATASPPLHLLSGGHGACAPVGMKVFLTLCFLQVILVPCSCHVFSSRALRTGKPENARTCQQCAQTPWARNRSEPFLTVPDRSGPFLAHGMPQLYMDNAAKLCFIVFWPLFQCTRTGRERFGTVPDCSWFTGIPESYCFTNLATMWLYHIDCVSSY